MKYEKFSFNGVNLYLIKTKDFKKITMRMSFRSPAVKKEITINNFLSLMLIYSTKNYPTSRLLSIRLQELYDMVISYDNYIIGNYLFNDFSASIINERYAEAGNLEKSISLFLETIFDPNIKSKKFDEKSFNVKRMQIKDTIDSIKENKGQYAIIRTKEIMDPKAPYSYIIKGYQSDLDKITPASLYKYYVKWLHNTQLDIYIAGDFDSEKVKSILQHKVPLNVDTTFNIPLIYNHLKLPKENKKTF